MAAFDDLLAIVHQLMAERKQLEAELAKEIESRDGWRNAWKKSETENERLRWALGNDLSGRPFSELLTIIADRLHHEGGGPLEDCIVRKAYDIDEALGGE